MKSEGLINASALETLRLFKAGQSSDQIAKARGMSASTIAGHLASAITSGELQTEHTPFYSQEEKNEMEQAAAEHGCERLGPLHQALGGRIGYEKLHIFRALKMRDG